MPNRLHELDGYRTVPDDVIASSIASLVSLRAIDQRYGDDAYGRADDYEDLPDLGKNA